MTEQEKLAMLEEAFEVNEGSLRADMDLDDIDEYDSMAKMSLIVLMEDEFGITLVSDQIKAFKTVSDILAVMNKAE